MMMISRKTTQRQHSLRPTSFSSKKRHSNRYSTSANFLRAQEAAGKLLQCGVRQLSSLDESSVVHVFEFAVRQSVPPIGMLPIFVPPPTSAEGCDDNSNQFDDSDDDDRSCGSLSQKTQTLSPDTPEALLSEIDVEYYTSKPQYRIYTRLTPGQLNSRPAAIEPVFGVPEPYQQFVGMVITANGTGVYTFECDALQAAAVCDQIIVGGDAAVAAIAADGELKVCTGHVLSIQRTGTNVDTVKIEASEPLLMADRHCFALLRDRGEDEGLPNEREVIAVLQGLGFFADVATEEISADVPLPPELELILSGELLMLGVLGAYQPHQYTLGVLQKVVAAVVIRGTASIAVDETFFAVYSPAPGDPVYVIATTDENTHDVVFELCARHPEPMAQAAVYCYIGSYLERDNSHDLLACTISIENMPARGWRRLNGGYT